MVLSACAGRYQVRREGGSGRCRLGNGAERALQGERNSDIAPLLQLWRGRDGRRGGGGGKLKKPRPSQSSAAHRCSRSCLHTRYWFSSFVAFATCSSHRCVVPCLVLPRLVAAAAGICCLPSFTFLLFLSSILLLYSLPFLSSPYFPLLSSVPLLLSSPLFPFLSSLSFPLLSSSLSLNIVDGVALFLSSCSTD